VKKLPAGDIAWLEEARGKAVKVISALLTYLPSGYHYRVLFLHRDIAEVLASQREMLKRRGEAINSDDERQMAELFQKHVGEITNWLDECGYVETLHVSYNEILANPEPEIEKVAAFLQRALDKEAMLRVIDARLYRNRTS
jgi:hypothetical protein